ncbi:MAG: DUF4011 domain-containing protein [Deltaproteobacteria bacterium]|jgi:superfamily I DNA and/or RNA helicase/very-short-patch-repair endonuclease|nr:DUF4011 domain-containing protein [Deltaproteobacteria bacterium]
MNNSKQNTKTLADVNGIYQLDLTSVASYAVYQYLPVIKRLTVNNTLGGFSLRVNGSPAFESLDVKIPGLSPGKAFQAPGDILEPTINWKYLESLASEENLEVVISSGGQVLEKRGLKAYPQWIWPGKAYPESIAFFIEKSPPFAAKLESFLEKNFPLISQTNIYDHDFEDIWSVFKTIIEIVRFEGLIIESSRNADFLDLDPQIVYIPSELLIRGSGTQLEISLLLCSAFEARGLKPLILFTQKNILAGIWLQARRFNSVWTEDQGAVMNLAAGSKNLPEFYEQAVVFIDTAKALNPEFKLDLNIINKRAKFIIESPGFLGCLDISRAREERSNRNYFHDIPKIVYPQKIVTLKKTLIDENKDGKLLFQHDDAVDDKIDDHKKEIFAKTPLVSGELPPNSTQQRIVKYKKSSQSDILFEDRNYYQSSIGKEFNYTELKPPTQLSKIEIWKRKLLDLTLKNNFLKFQSNRLRVEFISSDINELCNKIINGIKFQISSAPSILEKEDDLGNKKETDYFKDSIALEISEKKINEGILLSSLTKDRLDKTLTSLYRANNTNIQESGSNTLYLIFGFLSWITKLRKEAAKAPLVLIPVNMKRSKAGDFTLQATDEESRFNLTLIELLRKDYKIDSLDFMANNLPKYKDTINLPEIFKHVKYAVKDRDGWILKENACLGILSFSKYLMWKDLEILEKNGELAERGQSNINPIIESLLNYTEHKTLSVSSEQNGPEIQNLDYELNPKDIYTPLLADSSQLSAIVKSDTNSSFVLVGPPGTGKSQTITNMIAHNISRGKTVLFVAEKNAALNVVHNRLKNLGLDQLCLELHSDKTGKIDVIKKLTHALENMQKQVNQYPMWEHSASKLVKLINVLNNFVIEHHSPYQSGITPYQAVGENLLLKETENTKIIKNIALDVNNIDDKAISDIEDDLDKLNKYALKVLPLKNTGLSFIKTQKWNFLFEMSLLELSEQFVEIFREISSDCGKIFNKTGLFKLEYFSIKELNIFVEFLKAVETASKINLLYLFKDDPESVFKEYVSVISCIEEALDISSILNENLDTVNPYLLKSKLEMLKKIINKFESCQKTYNDEYFLNFSYIPYKSLKRIIEMAEQREDIFTSAWETAKVEKNKNILNEIFEVIEILEKYENKCSIVEAKYDYKNIVNIDLNDLKNLYEINKEKFFIIRYFTFRKIKSVLKRFSLTGKIDNILEDLTDLIEIKEISDSLKYYDELVLTSRSIFKFCDTSLPDLKLYSAYIDEINNSCLKKTVESTCDDLSIILKTATRIKENSEWFLKFYNDIRQKEDPNFVKIIENLGKYLLGETNIHSLDEAGLTSLTRLLKKQTPVLEKLSTAISEKISNTSAFNGLQLKNIYEIISDFIKHKSKIHSYIEYSRYRRIIINHNLKGLVEDLEKNNITPDELINNFRYNITRLIVLEPSNVRENVGNFSADSRENDIKDFIATDNLMRKKTVNEIKSRIASVFRPNLFTREITTLNREKGKKKGHKPIRKLLSEIKFFLPAVTPCLLMSPLSIAQFLPPDGQKFDLVIFDEASQIPVWDAIGALARGKCAVIVGDPRQLPPTNFFKRTSSDEDYDQSEDDTMESILDECQAITSIPTLKLHWHYRSRSESLISFSNQKYYDSELITFPSPDADDMYVSFHYVENGIYDRANTRTNEREARAVVADIVETLKSPWFGPGRFSLGVVTFNHDQESLIQDLLDQERRNDPDLDGYFHDSLEEPVLVKNIENIQGDERDIIYFSICYGIDASGKISSNFGPINKSGGERRLNVAITRARRRVKVFASFRPYIFKDQIIHSRGASDLLAFMEYADSNPRRERIDLDFGVSDDPDFFFPEFVARLLEKKGWTVHRNVGVSSLRVDLAVVNKNNNDKYILGVECDGKSYKNAKTALDREYLRGETLKRLGWRVIRVWSLEWFRETKSSLEKLDAFLRHLQNEDATTSHYDPFKPEKVSNEIFIEIPPHPPESEKATEELEEDPPPKPPAPSDEPLFFPYGSDKPLIEIHPPLSKDAQEQPDANEVPSIHRDTVQEILSNYSPITHEKLISLLKDDFGKEHFPVKDRDSFRNLARMMSYTIIEHPLENSASARKKIFYSQTILAFEKISPGLLIQFSNEDIDDIPLIVIINLAYELDKEIREVLLNDIALKLKLKIYFPRIKNRIERALDIYYLDKERKNQA